MFNDFSWDRSGNRCAGSAESMCPKKARLFILTFNPCITLHKKRSFKSTILTPRLKCLES